ncbi:MAG: BMP family ABC transporter substrate-binding protein [Candidatus Bipolaricaulota bacterium]
MRGEKNFLIGSLVLFLVIGFGFTAPVYGQNDSFEVAFLGDVFGTGGFWDLAKDGVERAEEQLGVKAKVVEMGTEPSKWKPAIRGIAATGRYDLIITGAPPKADVLQEVAPSFPDQKFLLFDAELEGIDNVHSVTYAQNEGGFLGGVFAALVTTYEGNELEYANAEKTVGFIGLMDHPLINDFLEGYRQGVNYVDPEVEVLVSYVGDMNNPPKAKELAKVQFGKGADIIFTPASANNIGVVEAAEDEGGYVIGSDANQNPLAPGIVLTSVLKKADKTVFQSVKKALSGLDEIDFGETDRLGYPEGTGLAKDEHYSEHVPDEIKLEVAEAERSIESGEIVVESAVEGD